MEAVTRTTTLSLVGIAAIYPGDPTIMKRLTPIGLSLFALTLVIALSAARAATDTAVYLPLLACSDCTHTVPSTPPATPTSPVATPDPAAEIAQLIKLVNVARAEAGCAPVVADERLMRGAQDWTKHMASTFDYTHSPSNWYVSAPYNYPSNNLGENIAAASLTADLVFNAWMDSALHRDNIERCYKPGDIDYNPATLYHIGVGHAAGYWTLVIGSYTP